MEVTIKYQVINKSTISSMSYNQHYNILATVADGNDTATFYTLDHYHNHYNNTSNTNTNTHTHTYNTNNNMQLSARFTGQSRPPSSGCISWSPNGKLIAVGNTKVQIWKFQQYKMAPLKIINQGYIQIKNIQWSQDNKYYLCYGINHKDNPISINIRNIQTNQLKQILIQQQPIIVNFDPFGKYIVVLTLKNILELYDARTLNKIKLINLSENKNDILTLKDKRIGDWSPQYSYFLCINLNDSKISSVIIFDRNRNFEIKDILLGHQATITCAKFNPNVYQYQNDICFILAIGDSSGCISIWRIGKNNNYKQPLCIISSPQKAQQSVQSMQWNINGDILFVNVLKKYVILVNFNIGNFGRKLSDVQKSNLIIGTYGATGANQIAGASLEVFGLHDFNMKNQSETVQQPKVTYENSFKNTQKAKQLLIKTKQQVIFNKDANNKQKKRIIPSRLIPQSQYLQKSAAQIPKQPITMMPSTNSSNNQPGSIPQKQKLPIIKIPPLKHQIKREYNLHNENVLQIQYSKNVTILSIRAKTINLANVEFKQNPIKRFFNQEIKIITFTNNHIIIVSSQKLFIFDFELQLVQLPCFLGEICNLTVNNMGTVYYMITNGIIRAFNYLRNQFICQTSAVYLFLADQQNQITTNPFSSFNVFDNDSDRLHVQIKSNLSRYFYSKQQNKWCAFDFDQGFYMPGHSIRISKVQKQNANNFYMNLVTPAIISSQSKNQSVVNQFQLQLIYYQKYVKDVSKYKDALLRLLLNLKIKGNDQQLRKQIKKYFIDKNSQYFINDNQLWQKVKKIGGKIIQQFIVMENL